jgi:hypothetical protein
MGTKAKFKKEPFPAKYGGRKKRGPLLPAAALIVFSLFLTSPSAGAAIRTPADLSAALTGAKAGDTLTLDGDAASGIISFPAASNALIVNQEDLTLLGAGSAARVTSGIGGTVQALLSNGLSPESLDSLVSQAQSLSSSLLNDADGSLTGMTSISGNDAQRERKGDGFFNDNKWLKINVQGTRSLGNGLSLENLRFRNVKALYDLRDSALNTGIVNGLIGNVNVAGRPTYLGNITGSAFTDLDVTLYGGSDTHYLAGGGIVGVRSTGDDAGISKVSGNLFKDVSITTTEKTLVDWSGNPSSTNSAYIEGGGLVGVDGASSPGNTTGVAKIDELSDNLFTGARIRTDDVLIGGGLVGVNNNSKHPVLPVTDPGYENDVAGTYAALEKATGNVFSDVKVDVGYSIRGGGVIGVNALSTAGARLTDLSGNIFSGVDVTTKLSYIKGGGIVGIQANYTDDADPGKFNDPFDSVLAGRPVLLNSAVGNFFLDSNVSAKTYLYGGGIVGVSASESLASLAELDGNLFRNLTVKTEGKNDNDKIIANRDDYGLKGGGIVGVATKQAALLGNVTNNYFDNINVDITEKLAGGGVVGIQSDFNGELAFGSDIVDNSFTNIRVGARAIEGGGVVGAHGKSKQDSYVGFGGSPDPDEKGYTHGLSGSRLNNITVEAKEYISGGGVFGVYSNAGDAIMYDVNNNVTDRITVTAGKYIEGGGLIGIRANSRGHLENLENNYFYGSNVTAGTYIDGGGIVGLTSGHPDWKVSDPSLTLGITNIEDNLFDGNVITANNGIIAGGLIYSYGTDLSPQTQNSMTIKNSYFTDNTFTSRITDASIYKGEISPKVYGTVTIDTGHANTLGDPFTLTLDARPEPGDDNERVISFVNNKIIEGDSERTNSLYFGTVDGMKTGEDGTITVVHDEADADARLVVKTEKGGSVFLSDPIVVNQDNGRTFEMIVAGPEAGKEAGDFSWGGENVFTVDQDSSNNRINLERESYTQLLRGMTLDAPGHSFSLEQGAQLTVRGSNEMTLRDANLNGSVLFDLSGTTLNDASTALLKVHDTEVDIEGSTVYLSPLDQDYQLNEGDRFYLMATDKPGDIKGKQTNDFASSAYARKGYIEGYNFKVDTVVPQSVHNGILDGKALGESDETESNQYLVARLPFSKNAVDVPLHIEVGYEVDVPEVVYVEHKVGEPLYIQVRSEVGEPLHVEIRSETGEPEHVEIRTEVSVPLVFRLPEVDVPVYVLEYNETGDPPYVVVKTGVDEPEFVIVPPDPPEESPKPDYTPGKTDDPAPPRTDDDPVPPQDPVAYETTAITNGRLAGLAFAGARGTWLADHSYESANLILSKDLRDDDWHRISAPFAGIDGAWLRAENDRSHIKIDSMNVIAGYAVKTRHEGDDGKSDSSTLFGAFLDFGHGNYTTYDDFDIPTIPDIHGDGTLRAYGVGLMARREWADGFRLEGSLRAGKLKNKFSAYDYLNANRVPMSYETDTPYYGAHLGIGKTFGLSDPGNEVDLRLRYYWDRQGGETVTLPGGETVEFQDDDSRRLRFGARFTHEDAKLRRWYVGAAAEREFAGSAHARSRSFSLPKYGLLDLRSESLDGTTGIVELGVDIRPYENRDFSIATGIQGYFGKYQGISGGLRLEWEF